MTIRTGKEATMWERGFAPVGFLVLLFTLFLSQFSLPENGAGAAEPPRPAAEGGVAPSPLSNAADEVLLPAGGHAERRVAKPKTSLPGGDAAGKAVLPVTGVFVHPFEFAAPETFLAADDAAPARLGPASFRSRAPPVFAA